MIDAERQKDLAYKAKWRPGMPPAPPRPVRNELDWLANIGGPMRVEGLPAPETVSFGSACNDFTEREVLEILMDYTSDLTKARRAWPWVALILHWFEVASKLSDPSKDLTPKEVEETLASVRRVSRQLDDLLEKLHQSWTILRDGAPYKNGHLEYLHQLLVQGCSGFAGEDVDMDVEAMMSHFNRYRDFRFRLFSLGKSAAFAQSAMNKDMLTSSNRYKTPGVQSFVQRLGIIWRAITGDEPKAYKVEARDPPVSKFVWFCQRVAALSEKVPSPHLKTVASALKAPPDE